METDYSASRQQNLQLQIMPVLWGLLHHLSIGHFSFLYSVWLGRYCQSRDPPPTYTPTSNIGELFKGSRLIQGQSPFGGLGAQIWGLDKKSPLALWDCKLSEQWETRPRPSNKEVNLRKEEVRDGERGAVLSPLCESLDPTVPESSRTAFGFPSHMNQ